ncbi:hypothetical protein GCM10017688_09510 [Streptomyces ramulosus]
MPSRFGRGSRYLGISGVGFLPEPAARGLDPLDLGFLEGITVGQARNRWARCSPVRRTCGGGWGLPLLH